MMLVPGQVLSPARRVLLAVFLFGANVPAAYAQAGRESASSNPVGEIPAELTRTDPSGLTAARVGTQAAATSFTAKGQESMLRAAAARVDEAWISFLPSIGTTALVHVPGERLQCSRRSGGAPGVSQVYTVQPPGTRGLDPAQQAAVPFAPISFPPILDNYYLQASIAVPLTDYVMRIAPAYSAATHAKEAARYDAIAARSKASADGQLAFYAWLRARGAAGVAIMALYDQRAHLSDVRMQFRVGGASRADALRSDTAVAAAELQVERAKHLVALTEKQVHLAIHAPAGTQLIPAESMEDPPPPVSGNEDTWTREALNARVELKSLDASIEVARRQATQARGGVFPTVSAVADAVYANPNPRVFPLTDQWFATWEVGAQLTWSPNEAAIGVVAGHAQDERANALEQQRSALRDAIELDVLQAYQAVREADVALEATKRELESATEAYRSARDLFSTGRITSTTLTDAETDITRARLDALNAKADARIARVRLQHAAGRDAAPLSADLH